jgi:hypothetical protein
MAAILILENLPFALRGILSTNKVFLNIAGYGGSGSAFCPRKRFNKKGI